MREWWIRYSEFMQFMLLILSYICHYKFSLWFIAIMKKHSSFWFCYSSLWFITFTTEFYSRKIRIFAPCASPLPMTTNNRTFKHQRLTDSLWPLTMGLELITTIINERTASATNNCVFCCLYWCPRRRPRFLNLASLSSRFLNLAFLSSRLCGS